MDKLGRLHFFNLWHMIIIIFVSCFRLQEVRSQVLSVKYNESSYQSPGSDLVNLTEKSKDQLIYFDHFEHYLNFSSDAISSKCRESIEVLEQRAKNFDFNAIKLLDANAKLPSGILSGNINNFGDFDECLGSAVADFQGKYCLSETQFQVHKQFEHYRKLILSNEPYRNQIDDITHILPRSSSVLWAICMPSHCSHKDAEIALRNTIEQKFGKYLESIQLKVTERNCQIYEEFSPAKLSYGTIAAITAIIILLLIISLATIYDALSLRTKKNEYLIAFSMTKNFKEIISTDSNSSEISSLNGIRFICSLMIIIGHKTMMTWMVPMVNRGTTGELYASYESIPHRSMFLYTEVFLMLSGLLLAHSLLGKLKRGVKINIKKEIAARYFRFMPPVIVLMLISTFILPLLSNGPLWPDLVLSQSEICKANGWRNLLMIQNWFGFQNICNFNLHHVGTDFVLFIVMVPIIVYNYKFPSNKLSTVVILCILSAVGRFYVSYGTDMSIYIRFGSDVKQMMVTANDMYGIPPYRLTSYSIGVLMGYVLRNQKPQQLGSKLLNIGWIVSISCLLLTAILATTTHMAYSPLKMAIFSAFTPILFCTFFAWIIYVSHHKSGNRFTRFFEWKYFKISSTLSYGLYLIQFQIFDYIAGTTRGSIEYSIYSQMFDINELLIIVLAAFLMTLLVELPFGNVKKLIFDKKSVLEVPRKHGCDEKKE